MVTRFAGAVDVLSWVGRRSLAAWARPCPDCGGRLHDPRAPASLGPDPSSSRDGEQSARDGEQSATAPSSLPPQSSPSRLPSQAGARRRSRPLAQARPALLDVDPRGRGAIRHVSRPSGSHTRVRETRRSRSPTDHVPRSPARRHDGPHGRVRFGRGARAPPRGSVEPPART